MITGLLENQQKQREQQKQDTMAAYLGQAPGGHAGGDSKSGLLSGLGGLLQGLGGGEKNADMGTGDPTAGGASAKVGGALQDPKAFSLNSPMLGQSGGGSGASSYAADNFKLNEPTGEPSQFGGFSLRDQDWDDQL
jgi:hypothetical protein